MTRLIPLLFIASCSSPTPDPTPARMAALEAQADRVDLAITRLELHEARRPSHDWAVTANGSRVVTYCLHCGVQYHTLRQQVVE